MALEGVAEVEVRQALCLLALCDIMEQEYVRAWMLIGYAARLQTLRLVSQQHPSHEDDARAHWSIMTLEKTFSPQSSLLAQTSMPPGYPKSAPRPQPPASTSGKSVYGPDLSNVHEFDRHDHGINANCIQTISIWGDIVSHIRDIRSGKVDLPWLEHEYIVSLYELEHSLSHQHLLRNVLFADRSPSELSRDREYWSPWVLMQITSHASQAVLHNPFVQLVGLRDSNRVSQPRSFLQQAVDQALFHAGWVFRMIQMCQDLGFHIFDPLVAQLVAATSTVPWLFQFARDPAVSQSAKANLQICESFLGQVAKTWPHVAHKKEPTPTPVQLFM